MDWTKLRASIHHHGRVRCEPDWRLDWKDSLEDCDLWFVWGGRGRMTLNGRETIDLHAGVCFWMRPGRTYQASHDPNDPLGVTYIHFDLWRATRKKVPVAALPPEVHEVSDFAFVDAATHRVVELLRKPAAPARCRFEAESLLLCVLSALDRGTAERQTERLSPAAVENQRKVAEVVSFITEQPGRVPALRELARRWGWSAVHFARVFRGIMGASPQAFIIKARLQRARQLLRESNLNVSEIAAMLGYRDVFYFSHQFKAHIGQSPSEFRRKI